MKDFFQGVKADVRYNGKPDNFSRTTSPHMGREKRRSAVHSRRGGLSSRVEGEI